MSYFSEKLKQHCINVKASTADLLPCVDYLDHNERESSFSGWGHAVVCAIA